MVRKPWIRIAALAAAGATLAMTGATLAGCSHAIEGASEDANKNAAVVTTAAQDAAAKAKQQADQAATTVVQKTDQAGAKVSAATDTAAQKVVTATDQATAAVKDAPKEVDAALLVTPQVKTAIIRDVLLNDVRNEINVDTAHRVVHLKGHVVTQRMKDRAGDVAQDAIRKDYAGYTVSNELAVTAETN
ncbi:hypothetical protein CCAX7_001970 [Capsulimonas corticalis]|uniref:BON domain-containing protein n=1 Tax=Capsulimonas corticalis TaxID=2219043 RepID=A0A402CS19_9BACT|nr:BON domain-containing protein [Capsulimonas corticalis]BDI28146.1 hypothetical protein CCAX7_001970 [Capsulimonas corticalis]